MMIRTGNDEEKEFILSKYPYTAQVMHEGGSLIVQKCIETARENGCYQVRAYCDANNIPSHMLWVKNGFTVSPVKMENGRIAGSYVAYKL